MLGCYLLCVVEQTRGILIPISAGLSGEKGQIEDRERETLVGGGGTIVGCDCDKLLDIIMDWLH